MKAAGDLTGWRDGIPVIDHTIPKLKEMVSIFVSPRITFLGAYGVDSGQATLYYDMLIHRPREPLYFLPSDTGGVNSYNVMRWIEQP